ncbi:uncharacterized protein LOC125010578 [Mugil cephalus]|uniref:uncharacterized protein LOC125010578 n=1 Tax=Mugil cephalus TaxID=48193 RepID=UPI001FB698B1|nr:uncharacterized protein LOC125010578 [Mugil cephalus]
MERRTESGHSANTCLKQSCSGCRKNLTELWLHPLMMKWTNQIVGVFMLMLRRRAVQQRASLLFPSSCRAMLLHLLLWIWFHFIALGSMNSINQESSEEVVAEGRSINLTCKYEGGIYNIQWYRKYQRSRPEFLLHITESGSVHPTLSDFSAHINKSQRRVDLEISSAAVSDSAVYYCSVSKRTVRRWTQEALQDCFESTDWEALCQPHGEDISSMADCITEYIKFCEDSAERQNESFQVWRQGGAKEGTASTAGQAEEVEGLLQVSGFEW